MTKLTITLEDDTQQAAIARAIRMIKGVAKVTVAKPRMNALDRAIEDVKAGRVYHASSATDLIEQCKI